MGATYRSHTSLSLGTRTNSTWLAPSGIADNDILLAVFALGRNPSVPTLTPPAGWTAMPVLPVTINKGAGYQLSLQGYYKVASGESGSYTFTHESADSEGVLYCLSRALTGQVVIRPDPTTGTGTDDTAEAPGLTTLHADTFVLYVFDVWDSIGPSPGPPVGTTPTFTERYDPGSSGIIYAADGTLATAGATGDKVHTSTWANAGGNPWAASLIAAADTDLDFEAAALDADYSQFKRPKMRIAHR